MGKGEIYPLRLFGLAEEQVRLAHEAHLDGLLGTASNQSDPSSDEKIRCGKQVAVCVIGRGVGRIQAARGARAMPRGVRSHLRAERVDVFD